MLPLLLPLFHHITFDGHKPTAYENHAQVLAAHVDASSSFLFEPFAALRVVKSITFSWRLTGGALPVKDAATEAEKAGDDAVVRVGLLIAGKAPLLPFLAPGWIKAVRDATTLPADALVFVVAGARHPPGATWASPYDGDLRLIAAKETPGKDGWQTATHAFDPPLSVVGLWIMSDGDDTGARFDAEIRDLELN